MNDHTALLIIDVQQGFDSPKWGERNNPDAEEKLGELLAAWRAAQRPVIHVQHLSRSPESPLRPGQPGCEIHPLVAPLPGEAHFTKDVNSAFIGTRLEEHLRERGIHSLVVGGLTTDHCVSTSVRMAANLGFDTTVLSDGTATFAKVGHDGRRYSAEELHGSALASLHEEFATIVTTADVMARLR
jgi:nicotinamidase-related amidase